MASDNAKSVSVENGEWRPTRADLAAAVIAWRKRWDWNGHYWPTQDDRVRAIKRLERLADLLVKEQE